MTQAALWTLGLATAWQLLQRARISRFCTERGGHLANHNPKSGGIYAIAVTLSAALAATGLANASYTTTVYDDLSSWSAAVGGANECTWDFDPIGTPVYNGWAAFTDQYASYGVRAPGQFWTEAGWFRGLPYTQVGMAPETAWVFPAIGLSSGIGADNFKPLAFDAPIRGLAFHIVGNGDSPLLVRLFRNGEFLGQQTVAWLSSSPTYGAPQGGATMSSLVAFTTDVEFDALAFDTGWWNSWGTESLWVPTNAVPGPGAIGVFGLAALGVRPRRRG